MVEEDEDEVEELEDEVKDEDEQHEGEVVDLRYLDRRARRANRDCSPYPDWDKTGPLTIIFFFTLPPQNVFHYMFFLFPKNHFQQ